MSREIKFRAWDNIEKRFIVPANIVLRLDGHIFDRESGDELHSIELQQFTGLKDKYGKEIYEGDILKSDWGYDGVVDIKSFIFAEIECRLSDEIEIIGNIYENPELVNL